VTRRLLLGYLAAAVVVLLVLEIPLGIFYQQRETNRLTVDVERDATMLASYYEEPLENKKPVNPAPAEAYAKRTGVRVVVVDAAGTSVVDTTMPVGRDFSTRPEVKAALAGTRAEGTRSSHTLHAKLLYVAVPVTAGGDSFGAVRLTLDTKEVQALVRRYWLGLAAVALVVLLVIAALGWALARSVTRPLRHLTAAAARFATGDLSTSPPGPGAPPEIAALEVTMNSMAQRLDRLLKEQRAFVADASHQLRTPLTALRLRLENLQSGAAAGEAEDIGAAIDETARLTGLVDDLLQFARAEKGTTPVTVDLAEIVAQRVDTWSAIAEAEGVTLGLTSPGGAVLVEAVPGGVEQILDNLIDNAVAATAPQSRVAVAVSRGRERHAFTVSDEGPGLSDERKRRALDRFWRADQSRPGTGLGLPIAEALAKASGGSLSLDDAPGGGLAVTVELPAGRELTPARPRTR
jgi:signal transduction histidine kinase